MSIGDEVEDTTGYAVGYGRPPVASRFRPGQSGNPRGRRKGIRNFSTEMKEIARMPVVVSEGGKRKTITTEAAVAFKVREQALKGDLRAQKTFLELSARYNDEPAPASKDPSSDDEEILAGFAARLIARHQAEQATAPKGAPTASPVSDQDSSSTAGP